LNRKEKKAKNQGILEEKEVGKRRRKKSYCKFVHANSLVGFQQSNF